ncbi:MAG TPA: hypothetical protein PKE29_11050 [Phycisphaerales bacterium]|nr:hypothetical protein [Phycisphaerales bacterium]
MKKIAAVGVLLSASIASGKDPTGWYRYFDANTTTTSFSHIARVEGDKPGYVAVEGWHDARYMFWVKA